MQLYEEKYDICILTNSGLRFQEKLHDIDIIQNCLTFKNDLRANRVRVSDNELQVLILRVFIEC